MATNMLLKRLIRPVVTSSSSLSSKNVIDTPYGSKMPSVRNHWNSERVLATSLLAVIPGSFLYPCAVSDLLLTTGVLLHAHWGIIGVGLDYGKFLPGPLPQAVSPFLHGCSALAFACLLWFNFNDVGVVTAITTFWTLK